VNERPRIILTHSYRKKRSKSIHWLFRKALARFGVLRCNFKPAPLPLTIREDNLICSFQIKYSKLRAGIIVFIFERNIF